jgi:hypothetical protein
MQDLAPRPHGRTLAQAAGRFVAAAGGAAR